MMRLWHFFYLILVLGLLLSVAREPAGLVAIIVFATAIGEVIVGTTAIMALFQTIGALGMARGILEHGEAVAATTIVLMVATAIMAFCLFIGAWLIQVALP